MNLTRRAFLKLSGTTITVSLLLGKDLFATAMGIPVLLYHRITDRVGSEYTISPSLFASQMEWLYSMGYKTLSFTEVSKLIETEWEKAVIITFDDGWNCFMDYAFPLFKEYGFKATMNIIGKAVGKDFSRLSWDDCRYLIKSGLVDLGCHSYNLHSEGDMLSVSYESIAKDLTLFQETFTKETAQICEIIAWPYGQYNKRILEIAKKVGFKYILTTNEGYLKKGSDLHEIPRLNINNKFDLVSFRKYCGEVE